MNLDSFPHLMLAYQEIRGEKLGRRMVVIGIDRFSTLVGETP
jgi:hypothetical protein